MAEATITQVLDDLRVADEITRTFERRYWLSSADFYHLYTQGLLDDGEHTDDFAEWSAYFQVKIDREAVLQALSKERVHQLTGKRGASQKNSPFKEVSPCNPSARTWRSRLMAAVFAG